MATLPKYDKTGARAGEVEAPPGLFGGEPKPEVVHQMVVANLANRRQGNSHTKTRAEVAGSTRKLWRQKGTGRARVGDRRPPSRVGGGVAMGPRRHSHRQGTPARMKAEALRSALGGRAASGDVLVVEAVELAEPKTKLLYELLTAIGVTGNLLLVLGEHDAMVWRAGRNIPGLRIVPAGDVNAYDVLAARTIVLEQEAVTRLEERLA
jgi:large subunit ribosomal protein L4